VRVLHLDSGREYRGGQDQVRLLARELRHVDGLEQRLATRRDSELARRAAAEGVAVRPLPWAAGLDPRAWWRIVLEGLTWRPTVVHAHNAHAVTLAVWARRFLAGAGARVVPRVVATRRVVYPVGRSSALRQADHVIAISDAVRAVLVGGGFSPAKVTVVPSGIDADEVRRQATPPLGLRARLGLAPGAPLASNVAALEAAKDQGTLLRAARAAEQLRPDLHWVIAGDGPERAALEALVRRLGVGARVHLLGHVDRVDALLAESDVVVMSSREEGLGTVVLRAAALGKPVVATRAGGLPEIVPAPWLVAPGDAEALAHRVVAALGPASAPLSLPPRFTAAAMARGVLALYRLLA
jgi:L-malate glycosyltransferase